MAADAWVSFATKNVTGEKLSFSWDIWSDRQRQEAVFVHRRKVNLVLSVFSELSWLGRLVCGRGLARKGKGKVSHRDAWWCHSEVDLFDQFLILNFHDFCIIYNICYGYVQYSLQIRANCVGLLQWADMRWKLFRVETFTFHHLKWSCYCYWYLALTLL